MRSDSAPPETEAGEPLTVTGMARIRRGLSTRLGWLGVALTAAMPLFAYLRSLEPLRDIAPLVGVGAGWAALACFAGWGVARFAGRSRRAELVRIDARGEGDSTRIRLEPEGGEVFEVRLSEIAKGQVRPHGDLSQRIDAELELQSGDVLKIRVESPDEGFEILSLAGVDVSDQRIAIRLRMNGQFTLASLVTLFLGALPGGVAMVTAERLGAIAALVYLVGSGLLLRFFLRVFSPGEIVVGADGVSVGKFRKHTLPIRELAAARLVASGQDVLRQTLVLERHVGIAEVINLGPVERSTALLLVTRINRAIALAGAAGESLSSLDRGDRTLEQWRKELRRTLSGAVDYRDRGIPRIRVVETLEDPNAPAERRLGAAIALEEANDPEARRILMRVAEATIDGALARALRETAEGDLEEKSADALRRS